MKDFFLEIYKLYLQAIISSFSRIITLREYFTLDPEPSSFCIIRHDVDRKPKNALEMAELERALNIRSTYYFRAKPFSFKPDIVKSIHKLGHEIGYHYECLSDTNGNIDLAILDFETNLTKLRNLCPVSTIAMHGRPLKPYNNSDMWRDPQNHIDLKDKYNILGEVYLDIDYSDIAYITDTGRNWSSTEFNICDKVNSRVAADFNNGKELLNYLRNNPHPRLIFQTHPERWASNSLDYFAQLCQDATINAIKSMLYKKTEKAL